MKVIVMVKATPSSEAGELPSTELLTAMGAYNEELVKAGIMLAGEGLHPSSAGVRVRFSGANRTVVDGPFTETKELVAGYWLWNVKSMQEAIDWVKRCPNPMREDSEIEIRRVYSAEDFGAEFTPALREQEAAQKAVILGLAKPTFCDASERIVVGVNASYTMATRGGIPAQWGQYVSRIPAVLDRVGSDSFGVCWNSREDCGFDYLCGVESSLSAPLPKGMTKVTLQAGRYAVVEHREHISKLPDAIDKIWTQWIPDSGLSLRRSPFFERYTAEFNPETGIGGTELWIPIES